MATVPIAYLRNYVNDLCSAIGENATPGNCSQESGVVGLYKHVFNLALTGTTTVVSLPAVPVSTMPVDVYYNGVRLILGRDYTLDVTSQYITLVSITGHNGDTVTADYWLTS